MALRTGAIMIVMIIVVVVVTAASIIEVIIVVAAAIRLMVAIVLLPAIFVGITFAIDERRPTASTGTHRRCIKL